MAGGTGTGGIVTKVTSESKLTDLYNMSVRVSAKTFGLLAVNYLPKGLGLLPEEQLLLEFFLEKQYLVNRLQDRIPRIVWWADIIGIFNHALRERHEKALEQAYKELLEELNENINIFSENAFPDIDVTTQSEELASWRTEIRYTAQIITNILTRVQGRLRGSPQEYELSMWAKNQAFEVAQRRRTLVN